MIHLILSLKTTHCIAARPASSSVRPVSMPHTQGLDTNVGLSFQRKERKHVERLPGLTYNSTFMEEHLQVWRRDVSWGLLKMSARRMLMRSALQLLSFSSISLAARAQPTVTRVFVGITSFCKAMSYTTEQFGTPYSESYKVYFSKYHF